MTEEFNPQLKALLDQHVLYREPTDEYVIPKFKEFCVQLNTLMNQKAYMGEIMAEAEDLINKLMSIEGVQLKEPEPEFLEKLAKNYPDIAKDIGIMQQSGGSIFETKD